VLASFTETCQRHAINPWIYLADVRNRLPSQPVEQLADFLPNQWAAAHVAA
jgi:transposase